MHKSLNVTYTISLNYIYVKLKNINEIKRVIK